MSLADASSPVFAIYKLCVFSKFPNFNKCSFPSFLLQRNFILYGQAAASDERPRLMGGLGFRPCSVSQEWKENLIKREGDREAQTPCCAGV